MPIGCLEERQAGVTAALPEACPDVLEDLSMPVLRRLEGLSLRGLQGHAVPRFEDLCEGLLL